MMVLPRRDSSVQKFLLRNGPRNWDDQTGSLESHLFRAAVPALENNEILSPAGPDRHPARSESMQTKRRNGGITFSQPSTVTFRPPEAATGDKTPSSIVFPDQTTEFDSFGRRTRQRCPLRTPQCPGPVVPPQRFTTRGPLGR